MVAKNEITNALSAAAGLAQQKSTNAANGKDNSPFMNTGRLMVTKFPEDGTALVVLSDLYPTFHIAKNADVWMEIYLKDKTETTKLVVDRLHPSENGKSMVFKALGRAFSINKEYFEKTCHHESAYAIVTSAKITKQDKKEAGAEPTAPAS